MAESRPVEMAVWEGLISEAAGILFLDGERIGRKVRFSEFISPLGIDLSPFAVPDQDCNLLEKDVFCPMRKRIVARAGCAYGAPVYLQRIRHRNDVGFEGELLDPMVVDWDPDETPLAESVREKHQAALRLTMERLALRWHPSDESITVNGEHLVKGVPARILRRLLTAYQSEGRTDFEYREFKRDEEINIGQKNANFEVRFYRLTEKLNEKCPGFSIRKTGRGKFSLKASARLEFEED